VLADARFALSSSQAVLAGKIWKNTLKWEDASMERPWTPAQVRQQIREVVQRELAPGGGPPNGETDLVRSGLLDSMGWIAVLTGIEELTHIHNFGNPWPQGRPQSIRALEEIAEEGMRASQGRTETGLRQQAHARVRRPVYVSGWGFAIGSVRITAQLMEEECGLPPGTLHRNAGIESLHVASENEDNLSLGQRAAEAALEMAHIESEDVGNLFAVSTTYPALPSFGAALHTRLLLSDGCAVLDAGGACVGLLNALNLADAVLAAEEEGTALVVASEVHSRLLASLGAPGALRGLFGDGACAFVLKAEPAYNENSLRLGDFILGCTGSHSSAFEIKRTSRAGFEFQFKGEQLGRAAVDTLARTLEQLERLSGRQRSEAAAFAIHEPNPRLVDIFAQNTGIPLGKLQLTSRTYGNLGSATCGVSLCKVLDAHAREPVPCPPLIFVIAVGPGLLWAGTYLY
jgi:3-oxoacyl-[acyl-carrier-protein] synthase III